MKKVFLITLCSIILFSCGQPDYVEGHSVDVGNNQIYYMKDTRTNLCFAQRANAFTCVPCDSVQHLIDSYEK